MKISVIVPVYNRIENLKYLIYCLKKQSEQIDELIISDDGSSVDVKSFIEKETKDTNFSVKYIWQEDLGFRLSRARNNGARIADGDFLIFVDQDVILPFDLIKIVKKNVKENYFLPFKIYWMNEEEKKEFISEEFEYSNLKLRKKELKKIKKKIIRSRIKNIKYYLGLKNRGSNITGAAFGVYKNDYIKVNGSDEEYKSWGKEDDDLSWRLYKAGLKSKHLLLEYPIIHLWHYFDSTKKGDMNEKLFNNKKAKLTKENFRCKYGYDNILDKDNVKIFKIK
ncbi:glycosyltransferase [uncultured Fusobacterium sp.]|uniref:glycosyltransferase n=1 Tax=uncultured Fusobacterium sp. TaxID=159267 RepID=UPI0025DB6E70|nr:glycosyltransferase [uncultured Fusobacterium sp.]